jgi:ferritin-like metal-binding protein YciE
MSSENLEALLLEQLQDVYYTESRLVQAMPWVARAATDATLRSALTVQAGQARAHVTRVERIFGYLRIPARTRRSAGMDGLLHETGRLMLNESEAQIRDAGLIAKAQRIADYQISAYGNLRVLADASGLGLILGLIDDSLGDERAAHHRLAEIAEQSVLPALWAPEPAGRVQSRENRHREMDVVDGDDVEWM